MKKKKSMSLSDVAMKGGNATLKKHGREHYQRIAAMRWEKHRQKNKSA
jgi:hypothetical protein